MKTFTDFNQSKILAKFLPVESADLYYLAKDDRGTEFYSNPSVKDGVCEDIDVPCWSLAALLGVIPKPVLVQNSEGTWLLHSWVNDYPWSVGGYSNPIDACYEMILKLHELKML